MTKQVAVQIMSQADWKAFLEGNITSCPGWHISVIAEDQQWIRPNVKSNITVHLVMGNTLTASLEVKTNLEKTLEDLRTEMPVYLHLVNFPTHIFERLIEALKNKDLGEVIETVERYQLN